MKGRFFLFVLAGFILACSSHEHELPTEILIHENWQFSEHGSSDWHPATVPGLVHLDLFQNNQIEDPFWENNELEQRWIEEKDWVYTTSFDITDEILSYENMEIQFDGLDTYARVELNGQEIIVADNMFRSWSASVKDLLKERENRLKVYFESPLNHNRVEVSNYPYKLPSGNETADIGIKVSSFTRKAAYHFGWDWGPRFVTSGIWKPVKLCAWNRARIQHVATITQKQTDQAAKMKTEIALSISDPGDYEIRIGNESIKRSLEAGEQKVTHEYIISNPELWWCNVEGENQLYDQVIEIRSDDQLVDKTSNRFGIRTIELINEPDSTGTSFYFELNGKPVFMKGANYIPQDVFLPRVEESQYEELILAVKEAGMNMLRVWGGGVYERDIFYELCDEHGILVWQDFMFANSLYPDDQDFRENITQEVKEQIDRLKGHPCISLWCGNNEIEVAWNNWGWQDQNGYSVQDSTEIWDNYVSIFEELIPNLVESHSPEISYTSTSPLSNWGRPENFNHSSMHYWGVWHGREPFENFETNVGRFMVEYGFQSFPDLSTLKKVMADSSLYLESAAMQNRQKSYIGNGLIMDHIEQYYDTPKDFEEFIERSQEVQAKGLGMALDAHLDARPHCMGTLFWQLNDCWPGPSWSVIDYYGNKKKTYYVAKEKFTDASQTP